MTQQSGRSVKKGVNRGINMEQKRESVWQKQRSQKRRGGRVSERWRKHSICVKNYKRADREEQKNNHGERGRGAEEKSVSRDSEDSESSTSVVCCSCGSQALSRKLN